MKTYQEIAPTITFPTTVDEITQATIFDWFRYKEICDDDKFELFFLRVLNRDMPRYEQLLRIEPGISEFDWLVENYQESQRKGTGTRGTIGTNTDTSTRTLNLRDKTDKTGTITDAGTHSNTRTDNLAEKIENGTVKDTGTITDTDTRTLTKSGAYTHTQEDNRKVHNNTETYRDDDNYTESEGYTVNDNKRLEKNNPMSISYASGVDAPSVSHSLDGSGGDGGANASGGVLDWRSPSGQSEDFGRDINYNKNIDHTEPTHENSETYVESLDGVNPATLTDTTTYNSLKDTHGGALTKTLDTTKTTNYTKTNSGTVGNTGTDGNTKTFDTLDDVTRTGTDKTVRETGIDTTMTDENRTRFQSTGRTTDPATLLSRAKSYISGTVAWEWLYKQLSVCFIMMEDI